MATWSDDFNRADADPIGTGWTTVTNCNPIKIVSQKVSPSVPDSDCIAYWNANTPANDQYAEVTLGGTTIDDGPAVRISASAKTFYFISSSDGSYYICKYVNGAWGRLGTSLGTLSSYAAGDVLRLEASGNQLKAFKNGSQVGTTVTDTSISSGYTGLFLYMLGVAVDNFAGGDLTPALDQSSFQFFNDDGSESAATSASTQGGNVNLASGGSIRLRLQINATNDPAGSQFQLEFRRKPSGGAFGSWVKVV